MSDEGSNVPQSLSAAPASVGSVTEESAARATLSVGDRHVAAYREKPHIVQLMHATLSRLRGHPHHREAEGLQNAPPCLVDGHRPVRDPYTAFFAAPRTPTTAAAAAVKQAPPQHGVANALRTHGAGAVDDADQTWVGEQEGKTDAHRQPRSPSLAAVVRTAQRIVQEEEAVRHSPVLPAFGHFVETSPASSLSSSPSVTSLPTRTSSVYSTPQGTPSPANDQRGACSARTDLDGGIGTDAAHASAWTQTDTHTGRTHGGAAIPAQYVPIQHLPATDSSRCHRGPTALGCSRGWRSLFSRGTQVPQSPEGAPPSTPREWHGTFTPSRRGGDSAIHRPGEEDPEDLTDPDDGERRTAMCGEVFNPCCCRCGDWEACLFCLGASSASTDDGSEEEEEGDTERGSVDQARRPLLGCPASSDTGGVTAALAPPSPVAHVSREEGAERTETESRFPSRLAHRHLTWEPEMSVQADSANTAPARAFGCPGRACLPMLRRCTWRWVNIFAPAGEETNDPVLPPAGIVAASSRDERDFPSPARSPHSSFDDGMLFSSLHDRRRQRFREAELPCVARLYCLLNYVATLLTALAAAIVLWRTYATALARQPYDVRDGTVCHTLTFTEHLRPDLSFSVACFLVNSYFLVWVTLRAVRHESPGLLLAHALLAVVEVSRIVYFVEYVSGRYLSTERDSAATPAGAPPAFPVSTGPSVADPAAHERALWSLLSGWGRAVDALLVVAAAHLIAALLLAWPVWRAFGWRRFLRGWTQPESLALRRRLASFQTCLQLDGIATLNVALALAFLLDNPLDHLANACTLCATWILLALLRPLLHRAEIGVRYGVIMAVAGGIFGVSTTFYVVTIVRNLRDYTFDTVTDNVDDRHRNPRKSPCYKAQLSPCLAHRTIFIVPRHNNTGDDEDVACTWSPRLAAGHYGDPMGGVRAPWRNGSSTFLPTKSTLGEWLQLSQCPVDTCFPQQGEAYVGDVHRCCAGYGICRLKDAFRTFGVVLVLFLTVALLIVRGTLLWLSWRRASLRDDDAIVALRRQRGRHRRGRRGRVHGVADVRLPEPPERRRSLSLGAVTE